MSIHIPDHELLSLVEAHATDGSPSNATASHLAECTKCQDRLANLSGEGEWLTELQDVLDVDRLDDDGLSVSPSVSIMLDGTHNPEDGVDATRVKLEFLETPRHPELLGRLGRYDIERLVGAGGFGIVFKAHDSELHRTVALKVLSPHLMTSGAARKRFAREAQAAAAIHHENVIPIFDVKAEDRVVYLVMPFIAGSSLQERVDRDGPLSVEEILRIGAQIAAGLAAAHQQAVIHRDVKPANVLLESSLDRVLISDFGLARTADDASLTRSGVITGTPHYMSPEQATGEDMDDRSDLFSLGSVLYFMCTGHPPFRAPQVLAVLNQISRKEPRSIELHRNDIPFQLQSVIHRLLKKSPAKRFASAGEVCHELTRLLNAYQKGKLRRRTPSILHHYRSWLVPAVGLVVTTIFLYGTYLQSTRPSEQGPSTINSAIQDNHQDSDPVVPENQGATDSAIDTELLDDSFDDIAVETASLLHHAEEAAWSTAPPLPTSNAAWRRQLDELDIQLRKVEELFENGNESLFHQPEK